MRRATGHTEVERYEPTTIDEIAGAPSLVEVTLTERFSGDIAGTSTVRVIQVVRGDGSIAFVALQRVRGTVGERTGSFLLQTSGSAIERKTKAEWFVVPGSGTGELQGLRGDGGFEAQLGERGSFWLNYDFE